jgi:cytochrome c oxidase cbb3-type subunit 4
MTPQILKTCGDDAMAYEPLAQFAQTWGLLYAFLIFLGAVGYALWPKNQTTFDHAARLPLDDDE